MADQKNEESKEYQFSLTRQCGFALSRIEQGVRRLEKRVGGQVKCDEKTRNIQKEVGGMIVRYFRSSNLSSEKEIGEIGIDLTTVRREMEDKIREMEAEMTKLREEVETARREREEMKTIHEKWIEEGRQRDEEKKREAERKRIEAEERRRNVKEGAAAIEVFQQNKITLSGNVFTKSVTDWSSIFSLSFGPVVVRLTLVIRNCIISNCLVGLIAPDMVEQANSHQGYFSNLKRAASWSLSPACLFAQQNCKYNHQGSACKAMAVGQRVVLEADGREGKRTLRLSQDGELQPTLFSNIPVPFRFGIEMYATGASVDIVSTEVLGEASMVGVSLEVVMD